MKTSIIALGNSLRGFDFKSIKGHRIVLNNGHKYLDYDLNVWYDCPPIDLFKVGHNLETLYSWGGEWKPKGRPLNRENNKTVSTCNSSLILAINIALKLGYKEIDIYGADGYCGEYYHFYDKDPTNLQALHNRQLRVIQTMLEELEYLPDESINFISLLGD